VKDAASTTQIMKWRWAGHAVRLDHRRWAHATTLWDPKSGLRGPGRQTTRWADDMKNSDEKERLEKLRESVKSASVSARVYESSRHR
jgi:hypothetical protein